MPVSSRFVSVVAVCAVLASAVSAAQAKPDFSGSWIRDAARSTSTTTGPAAGGAVAALPIGVTVIRQTAATLTIVREIMAQPITYVFKLDGAESVNRNGAVTQTTRSRWNGAHLVTEGEQSQTTSQGYAKWTLKATRALDAAGRLIVDTILTDLDGVVTTSHEVFTKKPR